MRNVTIPNLVGRTVQEARKIIGQALFEVGIVDHEDGGKDESDIIYYQDPEFGSLRDQGMQIDLWASKKTPAELQNKIRQLDEMYRPKIDTTLAPIQYNEVPQPTIEQRPVVPKPPVSTSSSTSGTTSTTPKPKPVSTQPSNTSTPVKQNTTTPPSTKPGEKPKPKKVVIE